VELAFTVLPPWWRSEWAWVAYGMIGGVLIAGYIRVRTHTLRRRAADLEAVVAARTEELRRSNLELVRLNQLELDEKIAARLAEEKARLEVLRYQLNPHFLFNALTSVCSQLPPSLSGARAILERLTDFCQLTLFQPASGGSPTLGQEMKMLTTYLAIEQTRWGDLLEVSMELDPAAAGEKVPSLLLLPLVENALKYGQATSRDKLRIRLAARRDAAGALIIEIANTGQWVAPTERGIVPSLGIGHENLRQRLQRYYPGAHEFATTAADGWVTVRLRLSAPLRE
jgi:two-component system LytT family sensor kinase